MARPLAGRDMAAGREYRRDGGWPGRGAGTPRRPKSRY